MKRLFAASPKFAARLRAFLRGDCKHPRSALVIVGKWPASSQPEPTAMVNCTSCRSSISMPMADSAAEQIARTHAEDVGGGRGRGIQHSARVVKLEVVS